MSALIPSGAIADYLTAELTERYLADITEMERG